MKLLEENISKTFSDINHACVFLGQFLKEIEIKAKLNKGSLIQFTGFCIVQETIKKKNYKWEKVFANNLTDKGSISKIHKQLIQINNNKITYLKMGRALYLRHFSKDIQMTNKHMERYSTSLIIIEMKTKATTSQPLG